MGVPKKEILGTPVFSLLWCWGTSARLIPLLHPRSVPGRFQCVQESGLSHLPLRAVKFMTSGLSSAQACPWKPLSPACLLLREEYSHSSLGQMCMSEYCSHVLEPHQVETFLSGNTCTKPPEHHSSASPAVNMLRTHTAAYGYAQLPNAKSLL